MQAVAYPCLVMASLTILVGLLHLFFFIRGRREIVHLPFALLCFAVAAYDIFSIGLYDSSSLEEGLRWQSLQLHDVDVISVSLVWFTAVYCQRTRSRILWIAAGWFVLLFSASFVLDPSLTLSAARPSVKHITIPGLLSVTYYEGELGAVYELGVASAVVVYLYLLALFVQAWRRARSGRTLLVVVGIGTYFAGVVNDTLVASRVYDFIYLSEYAFMFVIACMFYALLSDLAGLFFQIEEANRTLEARVSERTREIQDLNESLRRQAEMDALTGIYNRRFFQEYVDIELKRARSRQEHRVTPPQGPNDMNFGLAMIDIDHFKRVNDTWGHPAGDRALVETVRTIQESIFSRDVLCRYGGEEFVILFTRTSRDGIVQALEKIRRSVEEHEFLPAEDARPIRVTVSIGAVIFDEVPGLTTQQFLRIADNRLLQAKNEGRNRAVYA